MSYILDALKRSERERALGSIPKLKQPEAVESGRGMHIAAYILFAVLLLTGAVFALQQSNISMREVVADVAGDVRSGVSKVADSVSGFVSPATEAPAANIEVASVTPAPVLAASDAAENEADQKSKPDMDKLRMKLTNQAFARNAPAPVQPVQDEPSTEFPEPDDVAISNKTNNESTVTAQPQHNEENLLEDLPGALGGITLDVHSYSQKPARRFVMIDANIFKEGAALKNGARLEEITEQGAVVSLNGQRYLIQP